MVVLLVLVLRLVAGFTAQECDFVILDASTIACCVVFSAHGCISLRSSHSVVRRALCANMLQPGHWSRIATSNAANGDLLWKCKSELSHCNLDCVQIHQSILGLVPDGEPPPSLLGGLAPISAQTSKWLLWIIWYDRFDSSPLKKTLDPLSECTSTHTSR